MKTLIAAAEPPRPDPLPFTVSVTTTSAAWYGGATNFTLTTTIGLVPADPEPERGPYRTTAHVGEPIQPIGSPDGSPDEPEPE